MPANDVTLDRFGSLMDDLTNGCMELMDAVTGHWEEKCAALLDEHARKLEALLTLESKTKANLRQEISELAAIKEQALK